MTFVDAAAVHWKTEAIPVFGEPDTPITSTRLLGSAALHADNQIGVRRDLAAAALNPLRGRRDIEASLETPRRPLRRRRYRS